jgi:uncharacterized protein (DUF983 family)
MAAQAGNAPRASVVRMTLRASLLRCPRCGGRGILHTWFKMKPTCPTCGLVLERGESSDYWLGAYMFNLVAAEMVAVVISAIVIIASWPSVAWNVVWVFSMVLAVLMPVLFFPFARDIWLAWDLAFRPREAGDVQNPPPPR